MEAEFARLFYQRQQLAFSFFRIAAIAQGVYKRSLDGNASNPERARQYGRSVPMMARLAMDEVEGRA